MTFNFKMNTFKASRIFVIAFVLSVAAPNILPVRGMSTTTIEVDGHSYTNVYLALSSDIPESQCEEIVTNIENLMQQVSYLMFDVTQSRVHLGRTITVVIPSDMDCGDRNPDNSARATPGWDYYTAPVRVGPSHALFGDNLWTQQPGRCGAPGDYIYFPYNLLVNNTDDSETDFDVETVHRFVSEWGKFRWGIMEEVGHAGDSFYPPTYSLNSLDEYLMTSCTDEPLVTDNDTQCSNHVTCTPSIDPELNTKQTSSIMSVPQLSNVIELCTDSTHNKDAPTKQNTLCGQLSAWEIFEQHLDGKLAPDNFAAPTLKVETKRAAPIESAIAIVIEATKAASEKINQADFLVDAVCQMIMTYLQSGVYLGVITFDTQPEVILNMTILPTYDQRDARVCEILNEKFINAHDETTRSINEALKTATEILPPESSIILITSGLQEPKEGVDSAIATVENNGVYPVVYPLLPPSETSQIDWYDELAVGTGTDNARVVEAVLGQGNDILQKARSDLSEIFKDIVNMTQTDVLIPIDQQSCTTNPTVPMNCSVDLNFNRDQHTTYLVSAYSYSVNSFSLDDNYDEVCEEIPYSKTAIRRSMTYICENVTNPTVLSVWSSSSTAKELVYMELVALEQGDPIYMRSGVQLWGSDSMRDLQFTEFAAPVLYAEVQYEGERVYGAQVTVDVQYMTERNEQYFITLKDTGAGVDTTGNDGIYSAYLTGFPENITSSNTEADLTLVVSAVGPGFTLPNDTIASVSCCGSKVNLPSDMVETPSFTFSSSINSRVTSLPTSNLPPGSITDLKVTNDDANTILTFTAPGSDLDAGTVSGYNVSFSGTADINEHRSVTSGLVSAGQTQRLNFPADQTWCNTYISYAVRAFDEEKLEGPLSNIVRTEIQCPAPYEPLSAGAIVGLIFVVLILLILILLIIYVGYNWKDRENLTVYRWLTCRFKDSDSDIKSPHNSTLKLKQHKQKPKTKEGTSGEIRSPSDLYAHPDLVKKHQDRSQANYNYNSGFQDDGMDDVSLSDKPVSSFYNTRSNEHDFDDDLNKFNMPYDLRASTLQPTLPINNVGIPVQEPYLDPLDSFDSSQNFNNESYFVPITSQTPPQYSTLPREEHFWNNDNSSPAPTPPMRQPRLNTEV